MRSTSNCSFLEPWTKFSQRESTSYLVTTVPSKSTKLQHVAAYPLSFWPSGSVYLDNGLFPDPGPVPDPDQSQRLEEMSEKVRYTLDIKKYIVKDLRTFSTWPNKWPGRIR